MDFFIGTGVLSWDKREREIGRWGTIVLYTNTFFTTPKLLNTGIMGSGLLYGIVKRVRNSIPLNDLKGRPLFAYPIEGEMIQYGRGEIFFIDGVAVGLRPKVMRKKDWLFPPSLFRTYNQDVDLWFRNE